MEFSIGLLAGILVGLVIASILLAILNSYRGCSKKIDITPEELEQARAILEREKAENIRLQIEANEIMKGFKD